MERRIDVIRTGFRSAHRDAALFECRKNGKRYGRLAGAGVRRRDDETARTHDASFSAGASAPSSFFRIVTISPITTIAGGSKFCA